MNSTQFDQKLYGNKGQLHDSKGSWYQERPSLVDKRNYDNYLNRTQSVVHPRPDELKSNG